ncbi:5'-methylthioadenosine/S-adenosylhomocysteine nucleosidase [Thermus filiformis]|uniref:adenosylhomocysteine nucleosidase n=1 Tax=Thermus filiformis TaxID=276 RepID=A0A0A2XAS5_THEFI|nr:5'-methylthioadenosine/S-adenosylhomocysteine nucleosidase [Thermus filiformis]KGQ22284.2 S-adenosylhomocysteine nucleosidase [Thermus filiformis]
MTALFAAEPEEAEALRRAFGAGESLPAPFPLARAPGVLLAETGVGKAAASSAVAYVLARYPVRRAFFLGVAGALDPSLRALDLLLAEDAVQWDVDLTPFGRAPGETAFGARFFPSDPGLLLRVEEAARALGYPVRRGRVATGDRFLAEREEALRLRERFGASAVEMEGAAALFVAWRFGVPMALVRVVTDGAGEGAAKDFARFLRLASERLSRVALRAVY